MTTKATPGPWHVVQFGGNPDFAFVMSDVIPVIGKTVCAASTADANLIAAAPDLLASLEQIERLSREADMSMVDVASMLGDIARAAIAKAEGRDTEQQSLAG